MKNTKPRWRRSKGTLAPAFLFASFAALALAGCAASPVHLDALNVDGRDGGGPTPTFPMLMRIGDAARAGGDLPNAVGVYRRAAEMAPTDPAPLIAAGDVLLQMGEVNEAIVSYHAALVRPGDTHGAQVLMSKSFLKTGKFDLALESISTAFYERTSDTNLIHPLWVTRDLAG